MSCHAIITAAHNIQNWLTLITAFLLWRCVEHLPTLCKSLRTKLPNPLFLGVLRPNSVMSLAVGIPFKYRVYSF